MYKRQERGVEAYTKRDNERVWEIIDAAQQIASDDGVWIGQVALRWLLGRPGVSSVLLGARTTEQLEQSLAVVDYDLREESERSLTSLSAPGLPPYPYGMVAEYCGLDVWDRLGTAG